MQQPVLLSPNFRTNCRHIFMQSPWCVTVARGIGRLAWQDEFFVTNPLDVKENYEHALDFASHLYRLFRSRWVWTFRVRLMLSFPNACLIIVRVSLFPRYPQNIMLLLCWIHRKIASGQILKLKLNFMVWVRERTIPTERPPLVGEMIVNLCG
jgi:hypothetical protein